MFPAAIREAEIVLNFGQILLGKGEAEMAY